MRKETTLEYYLSMEHGSATDKVPERWRSSPKLQPLSLYGLSSFNYSLAGLLLLVLVGLRPERSMHVSDLLEGSVMIWQGLISFKCDALDLGIRSWSHPTDRISATILTILLTARYVFFVRCAGPLGVTMYASLFVFLAVGLVCFNRSCIACREKNLDDYRKWHVSWHFTYPGMMVVFYLFQYLAPSDAISCSIDL